MPGLSEPTVSGRGLREWRLGASRLDESDESAPAGTSTNQRRLQFDYMPGLSEPRVSGRRLREWRLGGRGLDESAESVAADTSTREWRLQFDDMPGLSERAVSGRRLRQWRLGAGWPAGNERWWLLDARPVHRDRRRRLSERWLATEGVIAPATSRR
jgi:hypothetical protein